MIYESKKPIGNQINPNLNDSAKNGGPGFEKYADENNWITNNKLNIMRYFYKMIIYAPIDKT
mgnify:CR=1 FL=1